MHIAASVIIVTYNGLPYLEDCLGSLYNEIGDSDEVIIVDNNSSDGSRQFIRERYPQVRLIANLENRGFAAANNQGARLANGQFLLFLNQDTEVYPGWSQSLMAELARDDTIGLATSCMLLMSHPEQIHLCGQDVHYTGLVSGRGYGQQALYFQASVAVNAVSGGSFAIRRDLWRTLGGFDKTFFMYYEETDLSWRAYLAGFRCYYVPESQLLHDFQPADPNHNRLYHTFRNRLLLLLKSWRWRTVFILLPGLLLAELMEGGYALMNGWMGIKAKIAAYGWLFTHPRAIRRARENAQKHRQVADAALLASLANEIKLAPESKTSVPGPVLDLVNILFRFNQRFALWLLTSSSA